MKTPEELLKENEHLRTALAASVAANVIYEDLETAYDKALEVLRECQALMAGCAFAPERTQRLRDGINALLAGAPERTEATTPDLDYNERRTEAWVSWEFDTPGWDSRCADFCAGFDCGHADKRTEATE